MTSPDQNIVALGILLPRLRGPIGNFCRAKRTQGSLSISGQVALDGSGSALQGRLGASLNTEEGARLAERCVVNALAIAAMSEGTLDRLVVRRVRVYVACTEQYAEHHLVANGASNLLIAVFGESGVHARTALGVMSLPMGAPVEVEIDFSLQEVPPDRSFPCPETLT